MVMVWEHSDSSYCEAWRRRIAEEETLKTQNSDGWSTVVETAEIGVPNGPYTQHKLIGVAMMDLKQFYFPPSIDFWDGRERLTRDAVSLQDTDIRSELLKGTKIEKTLPHLSILGSCGRGKALLDIMRRIASNSESKLMAIEALKPLDVFFYNKFGFYTTTETFYPIDESNALMPMFHKFTSIEECPFLEADAFAAGPKWPVTPIDPDVIENANFVLKFLSTFLWKIKYNEEASELLRRVVVRQKLSPFEASKLWRMRLHCLAYKASDKVDSVPAPIQDSWFQKKTLDRETIKIVRMALEK
jgi:hypothetical protein